MFLHHVLLEEVDRVLDLYVGRLEVEGVVGKRFVEERLALSESDLVKRLEIALLGGDEFIITFILNYLY